jgi:hypothetical protein
MGVMLRGFVPRSIPGSDQRDADEHLQRRRSCLLHSDVVNAIVVEADGLFYSRADKAVVAEDAENRPSDSDSRWNRPNSESAKFPFEFKSANF